MKKTLLIILLLIGGLALNVFGNISLYSSLTGSGTTAGGLRYDFGNGFVADGTIGLIDDGTGAEKNMYQYFADVYYGAWGLAVSGAETSRAVTSVMYAIEQPINDKVTLGIAVSLASYEYGKALGVFSSYDIYAVLAVF